MSNRVMNLYSAYDRSAELFGALFPADADAIAIRAFEAAIIEPQQPSDISKYPDQFELYFVGSYDQSTGQLLPVKRGRPLSTGTQVISSRPKSA